MKQDLVSVIITTKDRRDLLGRAVRSVLDQTYKNLEIFIVDDGSTSREEYSFLEPSIKVLRLNPSRGCAAARNTGMRAARGDYICFLDDDDTYYPHKIEEQINFLWRNPDVDMVFSKVRVIEENGKTHFYLHDQYRHDFLRNFEYFNVIHTNSTLFKRKIIEEVLFDERLNKYTDMQFHLNITLKFHVAYLPITAADWYKQERRDQITRRNIRKNYENFRIICEIFRKTINSSLRLRWNYYKRLGYLSFLNGDVKGAAQCLKNILVQPV